MCVCNYYLLKQEFFSVLNICNVFIELPANYNSASERILASFLSASSKMYATQTSPSDFNPQFTALLSTMPILKNLVTSDIKPSTMHHASFAAVIKSFNGYNLVPVMSSTTILESFHDTSVVLPTPPSSTRMIALNTSSPITSSTNRWRCIEGTREYTFPAIEMEDLRFSLWQDTLQGVSYLYHVNSSEIGCSGTVTEIRFCYRVSLNVSTEEHIFTMSIMNSSRHVLKSVEITSTPTNSSGDRNIKNCLKGDNNNMKYCCDSMNLTEDGSITFPRSEFILSIETPNSHNQARLQNFRPNVFQGLYNISTIDINNVMAIVATTLPVIRFIISKS